MQALNKNSQVDMAWDMTLGLARRDIMALRNIREYDDEVKKNCRKVKVFNERLHTSYPTCLKL